MIQLRVLNRDAQATLLPTAAAQVIKAMAEPGRDRKKQKIRTIFTHMPFRKAPRQFNNGSNQRNSNCHESEKQS